VLRGTESDLLLPSTVAEMAKRGPRAHLAEFPDCGHAPALMDPMQIETILAWLQDASLE
jgi:pimeloyl-ACP methyl ester carboxylesterase